jgi:hypothetical protein
MKSVNATNAVAVVLGGLGVALELVAPFQTVGAAVGEVVHRKRRRGDAHLVQVCVRRERHQRGHLRLPAEPADDG